MSEELKHVHATQLSVALVEETPPHPPRTETPVYRATHHKLVVEEDTPCFICGVRQSTLSNPLENLYGAQAIETHHFPVERSLMDACDWKKLALRFPAIKSEADVEAVIDSEENMLVLCDQHHRHPEMGIHHLLTQDFFVQPYLKAHYRVVATKKDVAAVEQADEVIEAASTS